MKNLIFLACLMLIVCASCEKDNVLINEEAEILEQPVLPTRGGGGTAYPSNEMVIQYDASLTEAQKQTMRDLYGVVSFKKCTCADPTLELWIFSREESGSGGSIEEKVFGAKDDTGLEGADFNPKIQHSGFKLNTSFGSPDTTIAINKMVSTNDGVTIAILDTGVDYNYFGFDNSFLYNTQVGSNTCNDQGMDDYFGWDFVNQDNDPFDDYGHGTIVSSIITSSFADTNVNFQILPVKTFDQDGKGSYFDILCGFKYAVNNTDVDIINMSFGWYNQNYELLEKFIQESDEQAILTTSAGNDAVNTDFVRHYPSSYESDNLLSIAALRNSGFTIELASFSNYGINSVDIAATGENIPFYMTPNEYISVSGTSYSSAFVAAFSGILYESNMTTGQHINQVLLNSIEHSNLNAIKYSSFVQF